MAEPGCFFFRNKRSISPPQRTEPCATAIVLLFEKYTDKLTITFYKLYYHSIMQTTPTIICFNHYVKSLVNVLGSMQAPLNVIKMWFLNGRRIQNTVTFDFYIPIEVNCRYMMRMLNWILPKWQLYKLFFTQEIKPNMVLIWVSFPIHYILYT